MSLYLETFYVIKYTDRFYIFFHFYGILKMFHSVANIFNIEINSHLFIIFVELIQSSLFEVDPRTERVKYL